MSNIFPPSEYFDLEPGVITEILPDQDKMTLKLNSGKKEEVKRLSPLLYLPLTKCTKQEFRDNLKDGDEIFCLDSEKCWIASTVVETRV